VGVAFVIGFPLRSLAVFLSWEELLATGPKGVYVLSDASPLLGRKVAGKSQRALRDLGPAADPAETSTDKVA
jgi:hypothetical protein